MSKRAKISLLCWLVVVITGIVQLSLGLSSGTIGNNNGTFLVTNQNPNEAHFVDLVTKPDAWTKADPVQFAWTTKNDSNVSVRYTLDGNTSIWLPANNSVDLHIAEGHHTFTLSKKVNDKVYDNIYELSFGVDINSPVVNITGGPSVPKWTNDATPTFSWDSTDNLSGILRFECSIDNTSVWTTIDQINKVEQVFRGTYTSDSLVDGPHIFRVRAVDLAGNVSNADDRAFMVDTVPPTVNIANGPTDGATIQNSSGTISWSGSDNGSGIAGYKYRMDSSTAWGSMATINVNSYPYSDLANGQHKFEVVAVDLAGNISAVASRTFTVSISGNTNPTPTPSPTPTPDSDKYAAAPAVAAKLLKEAGIKPNNKTKDVNYISEVAKHMGPNTDFDEVHKEQVKEYEEAVKAFLNKIGAHLD